MGEYTRVIADLGKASEKRRGARSKLRTTATVLAGSFVENLRRGDKAELHDGATRYSVEAVVWHVGEPGPPDDFISFFCPYAENALVRERDGRRIVLSDPRTSYLDEDGIRWAPISRAMFTSEALTASDVETYKLNRPSDDELVEFLAEATLVSDAFQKALRAESARFREAVDRLDDDE